jgi:hypothetical protein
MGSGPSFANPSVESVVRSIVSSITKLISIPEISPGWLTVVVAYLLVLFGVLALRPRASVLRLVLSWVLVPVVGITFIDVVMGTRAIGVLRYWMVITPALYVLMAAGLANLVSVTLNRKLLFQVGVLSVVIVFMGTVAVWTARGELRPKPDRYRELARVIDDYSLMQREDAVFTEGSNAIALALGYYSRRDIKVLRAAYVMDKLKSQNIQQVFEGADVWLIVSGESGARTFLESKGYRLVNQPVQFGHIVLYGYAAP